MSPLRLCTCLPQGHFPSQKSDLTWIQLCSHFSCKLGCACGPGNQCESTARPCCSFPSDPSSACKVTPHLWVSLSAGPHRKLASWPLQPSGS